jgi:hypothetical protein
MILQYIKPSRLTLILGAFLAFMIVAAPQMARAQDVCDPTAPGGYYDSTARTLHNVAGRITQVRKDFLDNSPVIHTADYCVDQMIKILDMIKDVAAGVDAYHIFINLVLTAIFNVIVSFVCSIATEVVNDLKNIENSILLKICLPLPQLHLGLNFPKISNMCIGKGQVVLQMMAAPPTATPQGSFWPIWSNQNSNFQNSNPTGP